MTLIAFILFLALSLSASAATFPVNLPEHIGLNKGLTTTYVSYVAQDNRGIIWVGSDSGLFRFDGHSFKLYTKEGQGLPGNTVSALYHDPASDKLWVGTKNGIGRIDCATGKVENVENIDNKDIFNVTDICRAADGGIWIANHYHTILHLSPSGESTVYSDKDICGLPESVVSLADDGKGRLIIAHNTEGISVLDIATRKVRNYRHIPGKPNGIPKGTIHSVRIDSHKNIWLASNHGLSLFIPEREVFHTFLNNPANPHSIAGDHVFSINEDDSGRIWVGCDMGRISVFNPGDLTAGTPENLRFTNIMLGQAEGRGISNGNVRSIFEDSFGNVWICNYGSGLEFVSHLTPPFRTLPYFSAGTEGFDNKVIWSVFTDTDGTTLLGGTNSVGLYRNGKVEGSICFDRGQTHPFARVTTLGRAGDELLVGLYDDGLFRLDRSTRSLEKIPLDRPDIGINVIFNDPSGGTLIGCSEGILRYEDGNADFLTDADRILKGISVTGLVRDKRDRLWVGTYGNGVFIFDGTFSKGLHLHPRLFKSGTVKSLYADSRGWIWILTNISLCVVKNPERGTKVVRLTDPSVEHVGDMRAMTEDKSGNMWFSSDSGLYVWFCDTREFKTFPSEFELPNFNDRAVAHNNAGEIIFGARNGACAFTPGFTRDEMQCGKVDIVECLSLDHNDNDVKSENIYVPGDEIKISHDSSIQIVFSVADYAQASLLEYAVMLEGIDSDWSLPMRENHVSYRNLPPGKYEFKVRARLPNEKWDQANFASVGIRVSPPVWNTWWAIMIYLALIAACVIIWIKYYKRRLNRRSLIETERKKDLGEMELNEERLRFYTNITHELRTPLTLIIGPLEDLVTDEEVPPKFKDKIRIIHDSTLRLLNLINQLLEFRKTETQNRKLNVSRRNLAALVTEIGLRYKELNRNSGVRYVIDVKDDGSEIYFDTDIITTILNNLLSNAVKYTPEGSITLSLKHTEEGDNKYVCISVADTGYGIEPDALPHIFDRYYQAKGKHQASGTGIGLALVKSLSDLHGGILEVESTPGKGTVFTLKLIEDNTYPDALHSDSESVVSPSEPVSDVSEEIDSRATVLVVEDNADIREYISSSLGKTFRVIEAANGQEGLNAAMENNPDIIVSDLMMPVMDGLEMLSKVKGDIRTSHIPVVLLTAKDSLQDKEKGYDCGADSYLTKPFSAKLLKSRIHNILSMRSKLASRLTAVPSSVPEKVIVNELPDENATAGEIKLGKFDREFLEKFTRLVEENLTNPDLDMPFMQDNLNMSHSTLYRKVKGLTGLSGKEFIRKLRLRHVVELLADGCQVSEAAYESGFNDMGYFRSCFKEEYGMSPSSYAKKLKADLMSKIGNTPPHLDL